MIGEGVLVSRKVWQCPKGQGFEDFHIYQKDWCYDSADQWFLTALFSINLHVLPQ